MSYVSTTSAVLTPDFFRLAALAYDANKTDRKIWLQAQLINLQGALNYYSSEIQKLMNEGAKLDGKSDAGTWMTSIGTVAMAIPTIYTQIGGAVVALAGSIVNSAERKKDSKALQALSGRARDIQVQAQQIQNYYANYNSELQQIRLLPIGLFGLAAYLIYKK